MNREAEAARGAPNRPVRRTLLAVLGYGAVAAVLLPAADEVRRIMALPQMFGQALRLMLLIGLPIAMVLAWIYPSLGRGGAGSATKGDTPRED